MSGNDIDIDNFSAFQTSVDAISGLGTPAAEASDELDAALAEVNTASAGPQQPLVPAFTAAVASLSTAVTAVKAEAVQADAAVHAAATELQQVGHAFQTIQRQGAVSVTSTH
ncbi:hypothetical protein [Tsukamurella soli]|uniref:Excreted virulence factor EspC, type VII ESX diderm n=1 Tax=Tsukamurella soli TaxID=644556 RepID=A0ABP8JQ67_9ACTN